MKNFIFMLLAATCLIARAAGSDGRLVSWRPYFGTAAEGVATAALTQSFSPVVLYDPYALKELPPAAGRFVLLREEYVALMAHHRNKAGAPPRISDGAFWLINESDHYLDFAEKPSDGARSIDCLAFSSLNDAEKASFARFAREQTLPGKRFVIGTLSRLFTRQELSYVQTSQCTDYHLLIDKKLGVRP